MMTKKMMTKKMMTMKMIILGDDDEVAGLVIPTSQPMQVPRTCFMQMMAMRQTLISMMHTMMTTTLAMMSAMHTKGWQLIADDVKNVN